MVGEIQAIKSLLMTRDDAAAFLGVSVPVLYRLVHQGLIGRVKVISTWRYPRSELERFANDQVVYEKGRNLCPSDDEATTETGSSILPPPADDASVRRSTSPSQGDKWRPWSGDSGRKQKKRRQRAAKVLHLDGAT